MSKTFMKIIKQGAEAILYHDQDSVIKERISKGYRVKQIDDDLRLQRTKREVKCLNEALRAGVNVPKVLSHDEFKIKMEFIDGPRVKDCLSQNVKEISYEIGKALALLHSAN